MQNQTKPKFSIKDLQILQPHDVNLQDLISFLKRPRLVVLFSDDDRICQSLFPMNLTVSIPYVLVLTTGRSLSVPFQRLCDTILSLKTSITKSRFNFDFVVKVSVISSWKFLSWAVAKLFVVNNCSEVDI